MAPGRPARAHRDVAPSRGGGAGPSSPVSAPADGGGGGVLAAAPPLYPEHRGEVTTAAAGPCLPALDEALGLVAERGFARVPGALRPDWRAELLAELEGRHLYAMPERVNHVRQQAEQLVVPPGDARFAATARLARAVAAAVGADHPDPGTGGARPFAPNQAVYLRYRPATGGIAVHRDGKCYSLLVCSFTLCGRAPFSVVADRAGHDVVAEWVTEPGELCLLRGPGFAGHEDGRPLHVVGPPVHGERIALILRMDGRRRAAALARSGT